MDELSLHVLDLIQNSVEAGAKHVALTVSEDTHKDLLVIEVCDDGRGMDTVTVDSVFDPFYTTRTTRRVGLGLPLLQATSEATGGGVELISQLGEGTRVRACFVTSHPDCPPLGDMATTVAIVLATNPAVDFRYCHDVDGDEFCVDTREMKQRLQGIPLGDPAVYAWLKTFLAESLFHLHGGATKDEVP